MKSLSDVVAIMSRLRGPDGCPWDREQTSQSLKPHLLEEVYEVLEAIDGGKASALKEELGDLLLQIVFHTQIASEHNQFSFDDVAKGLADKLIRRHPHVFQQTTNAAPVTTSQDVSRQWDDLKQQEQSTQRDLPRCYRASPKSPHPSSGHFKSKNAPLVGDLIGRPLSRLLEKFKEELDELYAAAANTIQPSSEGALEQRDLTDHDIIEEELGDAFFALVNVSRFLRVNPEEALRRATNKFISRFHFVESQAALEGKGLRDYTLPQLDKWWEAAKHLERQAPQISESIEGATT